MAESDQKGQEQKPLRINPYTVPKEQQGWRRLSIPGDFKRKVYTVLHNDKVLVTALLQIPGEGPIRHSHESGELSIHFQGEMRPMVSWNPPGAFHGGPAPNPATIGLDVIEALSGGLPGDFDNPALAALAGQVQQLQRQVQQLQERFIQANTPSPAPGILIDILFPPFKTTIDDPHYPEKRTVTGQWFD